MTAVDWTEHERVLWMSCEIVRDITLHGQWPGPISAPFAYQLAHDERVFQGGRFNRMWYGALGDGSYDHATTVFGGTGKYGVALGAATLAASAAGNRSRRRQAQNDATPQWRPLDDGAIYLSTHGYYLQSRLGLQPFAFGALVQADINAPGSVTMSVNMDNGNQEHFILNTPWAELVFVLWAHTMCPHHPRLQNLGFLPPEFVARVRYAGSWNHSPLRELS